VISKWVWSVASVVWLALVGSTRAADLPLMGNRQPLLAEIQQAAGKTPDARQSAEAARKRLHTSIEQLERFLARGGSTFAAQWRESLKLAELKAELLQPVPDKAELQSILDRFYRNQAGLESPAMTAVRRSLRGYLAASEYAAAERPGELYAERLAELADCLARLDADRELSDAHRAGMIVGWLESLGDDGRSLARSVRTKYSAANAHAQVSGRLANFLLARDVAETNFMTDVVLGSVTRGTVFTRGRVSFGMLPNEQQGTLVVHLQGLASSPSHVAERGRVSVYSSALTSISANKQVSINDQGVRLAPAQASCSTSIQIRDIEAGSRLVERIAWRRAGRMLPEAENAASQKAASEASSKLDVQANSALGGANHIFCEKIRAPLIRFDALPPSLKFFSDNRHLRLSLSQYNDNQLSAAGAPPAMPLSYDLAGWVHESMVTNLCESLLGGRTVKDQAWLDVTHLLFGNPPRQLWVHDRSEPWSVTFSREQPLETRFAEDRLGFTLRLTHVTRGEVRQECPADIHVKYIPKIGADGPEMVRDGELVVALSDNFETDEMRPLKTFLHRKFGAVFPPLFHFHGITPPAGGSIGKLRQLVPAEFSSADGWLTVAYELQPRQSPAAGVLTRASTSRGR
jgi:hypothetical protein